jgi:hypothetical protein
MTTNPPPPPTWTAVSVLERSYALARDNFAAFITVTLMFAAVNAVADVLGMGLLAWVVDLVAGVATTICLTWGTLQAMGGRTPSWEAMLRQLQGPMVGRLLMLGIFQYLVIAASTVLVIPPFFLLPLWAVTIPAMMVERLEIGTTFQRSIDLTRYRRLPILGAFVLCAVVLVLGGMVIFALLGHGGLGRFVVWVWGAVAGTVVHPLPAIFYVLLREEKEAATVEQIAAAVD